SIKIIRPELKLEKVLSVGDAQVRLKGYADLVEERGGKTSILDYKTGKTEKNDIIKFDIEEITKEEKYKQPLQLLTYAYLLNGNLPASTPPYRCGIVSLQSAATNNECTFSFEVDKELLDIFSKKLVSLFEEIFNSEISFTQTEDDKHCKWCDYNVICGRGSSEN
ncbi:MAG: PD-(D/E)XK nuclease family protein, partial [Bacteroidales bacterium]|nr:PD-(D/E)XK nuclease family protein [Bacteroidales bacterium]